MKVRSLNFRLLLSTSLVLVAFFAIVAWVLEKGFRESAEQALQEQLMVQIYALLSAIELTDSGTFYIPENLPEPRLANPGSGLYGVIWLPDGQLIWRSLSAVDMTISPPEPMEAGGSVFQLVQLELYVLHYRVIWETQSGLEKDIVFTVAEDSKFVLNQVSGFRKALRFWLASIGLALLVVQFILLRWSLKPLRSIGADLTDIEQGIRSHLEGHYPAELQGLADNLNGLIASERKHLERYRDTLADLAHSIKTPLAIIRGSLETGHVPDKMASALQAEISRMNDIVEYHLQRAAAKGKKKKLGSIDAVAIIARIVSSLEKVYADKGVAITVDPDPLGRLNCETGDFYEIVGNLLDNACKWCQHQVRVTLKPSPDQQYFIALSIEDDGMGIDPTKLDKILQRGIRADENIHGHGIGLAVVQELVKLLNGKLTGGRSQMLGGMIWTVFLP